MRRRDERASVTLGSALARVRTMLSRLVVVGALAAGLLLPQGVAAQAREPGPAPAEHAARRALPADVTDGRGLALPAAPNGFVTVERAGVRWELPERARGVVEPLFETWDAHLPRIRRELGIEGELPPVTVRVGVDPEQMRDLAPIGAPPPAYAVGVAYPGLSLILLTLTAPETWQRPELDDVLVHELSHIALHHAVGDDGDLPLWLIEGVAIYQARERSIERVQTLWEGAFRGAVIDLDHLDERFPQRPHAVDLAYAQSADFVAWLLRRSGPEKLGEMIGRMRRGQRFEVAVSQTWSAGIGQLEDEWRADLGERFGALPMFATGSAGWIAVGVLVLLAWRRRRAKRSEIEERWAAEDARREQQELAYRRWRARQLARERQLALAAEAVGGDGLREGERLTSSSEVAAPKITLEASPTGVSTFVVRLEPKAARRDGAPDPRTRSEAPGASAEDFAEDLDRGDRPVH